VRALGDAGAHRFHFASDLIHEMETDVRARGPLIGRQLRAKATVTPVCHAALAFFLRHQHPRLLAFGPKNIREAGPGARRRLPIPG